MIFFSSLCGDASLLELPTLSSDATLSSTALVWADDSPCCRGMSGRQMTFLVGKIFLSETEPGFFLAHPTLSLGGGLFCFLSIPGTHLKNSVSSDVIVALYTIFELGLLDDTTALYIWFAFVTL